MEEFHLEINAQHFPNFSKTNYEEANIHKKLILKSKYLGTISYRVETNLGLSRYILFCYNLELPKDFTPKNNDGEITKFYLWPIEKILKANAGIANILRLNSGSISKIPFPCGCSIILSI